MAEKTKTIDRKVDAGDEQETERLVRETIKQIRARLSSSGLHTGKVFVSFSSGKAAKRGKRSQKSDTYPLFLEAFQRHSMLTQHAEWLMLSSLLGSTRITKDPVTDEDDLIDLARKRITYRSVQALASRLDQKPEWLAKKLGIEASDYADNPSKKIPAQASERALEVAAVMAKGLELFTTQDALNEWLKTAQEDLEEKKPIDLFDGSLRTKKVLNLLDSMTHGVYT